MGASEVIATIALLVSILSAWVSYRAYRHSVRVREDESRLVFSREKSGYLVRIDKARKSFDRLEKRIKGQLSGIDSASETMRLSLAGEAKQLKTDLKYLEGCQRQVWSLWHETYEMNQSGLAHHMPRFLGLIEDDEQFVVGALSRCERVQEVIAKVPK